MYRMMIVDDEPAIVRGLMMVFSEYQKEELELYPAYSAAEALKIAGAQAMDIVMTDIHMPGMNGLQLAEKLDALSDRTKMIFLTGYNEFDYIYQAMSRIGSQYVLKSEDDERIMAVVENAISMLHKELEQTVAQYRADFEKRKFLSLLKTDTLIQLLQDSAVEKGEIKKRSVKINVADELFLFVGNPVFEEETDYMQRMETMFQLEFLMDDCFGKVFTVESFLYKERRIVWLLSAAEPRESSEIYFKMRAEELQTLASEMMGAAVSVVFSTEPGTLSEIAAAYRSIDHYFQNSASGGLPTILNLTELKTEEVKPKDSLIGILEETIDQNVENNITLSALGDSLHYNASYLSRYYKKMTGRNLSNYLLETKLNRAKELLQHTDKRVNDIAALLGFESPSYFSVLFRKSVGQSPAEYRLAKSVNKFSQKIDSM